MRESVKDVLVILFCRQAAAGLALRDGPSAAAERELDAQVEALDSLRKKYGAIKDEVLATKAWSLRRSGSVGALFKFKDYGARDNEARDANLAVEVTLSETNELVVCCSRAAEDCLGERGCLYRSAVATALSEVCTGVRLTLPALFSLLSDDLRVSSMQEGVAILYGKTLCVVRRAGASWPFAVVRRKPNGSWQCHACQVSAGTCTHAQSAREASAAEQSDASEEDDGEDVRNTPRRRSGPVFVKQPRPLVPTDASQANHAAIMRAAAAGTTAILHDMPDKCPRCRGRRLPSYRSGRHEGVIEFGGGLCGRLSPSGGVVFAARRASRTGLRRGLSSRPCTRRSLKSFCLRPVSTCAATAHPSRLPTTYASPSTS